MPLPVAPQKSNRTTWIIVAIVAVILGCCCVVVVAVYFYGDQFLNAINGAITGPLSMLL
jgi:uncharacterized membrane protein